ncbi:unnamed protein product [Pleuronectes platessa]|uniref:Uncharacterized protein n=1 Tax=Pleuronectes platessa TaxID=8262 RepID=A0A9N7V0S6_PLEPL|nr:unnamed protein product [Pleuronectes platessa]
MTSSQLSDRGGAMGCGPATAPLAGELACSATTTTTAASLCAHGRAALPNSCVHVNVGALGRLDENSTISAEHFIHVFARERVREAADHRAAGRTVVCAATIAGPSRTMHRIPIRN